MRVPFVRRTRRALTSAFITVLMTLAALAGMASERASAQTRLASPDAQTNLTSPRVTFTWTHEGAAAREYWISVGTTGTGSTDIYNASTGLNLSATVDNIPVRAGLYIWVRIWTRYDSGWQFIDNFYFGESGSTPLGQLLSPWPGSTLPEPSANFIWAQEAFATEYWLSIGTTGVGSSNIFNQSTGLSYNAIVHGLPTSGSIYVRVWIKFSTLWYSRDHILNGGAGMPPEIYSPAPGFTLPLTTQSFLWGLSYTASGRWLSVGTTGPGSTDIYNAAYDGSAVPNLPASGTIYVRLWTRLGTVWVFKDHTYRGGYRVSAVMNDYRPAANVWGGAKSFSWTNLANASEYWLSIGSTGVGSSNLYNQSQGTSSAATVTGLPTSGTIYVRLYSRIGGYWPYRDYTYTGNPSPGGEPRVVLNAPGITLPATSQTFLWFSDPIAANNPLLWLQVGTTPGGKDVFNAAVSGTSQLVTNLPLGKTIYVRLFSKFGTNAWVYNDASYQTPPPAGSVAAAVTVPAAGSTFTSENFGVGWTSGTNVSEYWVTFGTERGGSDIYSGSAGVTPRANYCCFAPRFGAGGPNYFIWMRLWSKIDGAWYSQDVQYTPPLP